MFQFMRPVQDPNLRIMIPEELEKGAGGLHQQNHSGGGGSGHWSSNESEEEEVARSPTIRRKFKAYTVMQRSGFQHTEYVQILTHLCKAEIFISMLYGIHGVTCPGFPEESAYQGTCHINVLAALVGLFTGGMGIGAVHRFRWRTMLVCWLIMCIISAVANLLAVITDGVWLDHLSKLKTRTGMANGLSGMMLLGSVLVGVCFILTSVLICHYWASNSTRYQPVGRIAKRSRVLRRRSSKAMAGSGTERTTSMGSRGGGTTIGGGSGGGNGRFGGGGSLGSGGGHCSYQMDSGGHSPPAHWRGDAGNRGSRQISPKSGSGGGSPRYEIV